VNEWMSEWGIEELKNGMGVKKFMVDNSCQGPLQAVFSRLFFGSFAL
jgi:hypothetical protein